MLIIRNLVFGLLSLVAIGAFSATSQAAVLTLGPYGGTATSQGPVDPTIGAFTDLTTSAIPAGYFEHAWILNPDPNTSLNAIAASFDIPSLASISGFEIGLVSGIAVDGAGLPYFSGGTVVAVGTGASLLSFAFSGLSTSVQYGIIVLGTAGGTFGGTYVGSAVISAVPLPAAAWLFISALIGLVGVARFKRNRSTEGIGEKGSSVAA